MAFILLTLFRPECPEWVAAIRSEEYYVNMMRAWYFATALAKQYETVLPFLEEKRLEGMEIVFVIVFMGELSRG